MGRRWSAYPSSLLEMRRSKFWKIRPSPSILLSLSSVSTFYHSQKLVTRSPKNNHRFSPGEDVVELQWVIIIQIELQLKDSPASTRYFQSTDSQKMTIFQHEPGRGKKKKQKLSLWLYKMEALFNHWTRSGSPDILRRRQFMNQQEDG